MNRFGFALVLALGSFGYADEIEEKTNAWMEMMRGSVPNAFCKEDAFFRECFKVTEQECEKEAIRAVRICIETFKDEIKAAFRLGWKGDVRKIAGNWGGKVGECAGNSYGMTLEEKAVASSKCIEKVSELVKARQEKSLGKQ